MELAEKRIALVGDVVASREISKRVVFDETLLDTMRRLNERNPHILSPYTLIGDEIQAVFSRADSLFSDAISILSAIHPERMRFSFGIGTLVKPINPQQAIEMDGPAFHNARDGVEALKKTGHLLNIVGQDIPHLNLMKQALYLVSHNMDKWNRTRLHTLAMLQQGLSVKEIADSLHISDKAVYKTREAGALRVIMRLLGEATDILNESMG
jgi:hypothetical protein